MELGNNLKIDELLNLRYEGFIKYNINIKWRRHSDIRRKRLINAVGRAIKIKIWNLEIT